MLCRYCRGFCNAKHRRPSRIFGYLFVGIVVLSSLCLGLDFVLSSIGGASFYDVCFTVCKYDSDSDPNDYSYYSYYPQVSYTYLGCFADQDERDLEGYPGVSAANPYTCGLACAREGYTYFGLQQPGLCFCGNDYNKYGESNNCNIPCVSDPDIICGGGYANSVYEIDPGTHIFYCADEGEECDCHGYVRYGAGDTWTEWILTDAKHDEYIECTNGVFGDPIPGTNKYCECVSDSEYFDYLLSMHPNTTIAECLRRCDDECIGIGNSWREKGCNDENPTDYCSLEQANSWWHQLATNLPSCW